MYDSNSERPSWSEMLEISREILGEADCESAEVKDGAFLIALLSIQNLEVPTLCALMRGKKGEHVKRVVTEKLNRAIENGIILDKALDLEDWYDCENGMDMEKRVKFVLDILRFQGEIEKKVEGEYKAPKPKIINAGLASSEDEPTGKFVRRQALVGAFKSLMPKPRED